MRCFSVRCNAVRERVYQHLLQDNPLIASYRNKSGEREGSTWQNVYEQTIKSAVSDFENATSVNCAALRRNKVVACAAIKRSPRNIGFVSPFCDGYAEMAGGAVKKEAGALL